MDNSPDTVNFLKSIRKKYGISQKSLGILLGISEPSMVRYENGATPSKSNTMLLKLAEDPRFMKNCFEDMGDLIPADQQASMREQLDADLNNYANKCESLDHSNDKRISSAMNYIALHCKSPYFSRVIKGCFIADALSYEKNGYSLLGLEYAHAPHGPVIDGHKELRNQLECKGLIELVDDGFGFLFDTSNLDPENTVCFSKDELVILNEAARFVDSFETINDLSEATHELSGWRTTDNGQSIRFRRNSEVTAFVENRLYEPNGELQNRIDPTREKDLTAFDSLEELLAE